jgi:hypothetical protein
VLYISGLSQRLVSKIRTPVRTDGDPLRFRRRIRQRTLHVTLLIALAALCGCASSYALSPAAQAQRAQLSPTSAREIIAEAVKQEIDDPSGFRRAVVSSGSNRFGEWVREVTVSERGIEFKAPGDELDPDDAPASGCVSTRKEIVAVDGNDQRTTCHYVFDLTKIQSIRVIAVEPDDSPAGIGRSGYDVVLRQSFFFHITVNVGKPELDRFMAALTFFSPGAALSEVRL